jgi:hypothetical protein
MRPPFNLFLKESRQNAYVIMDLILELHLYIYIYIVGTACMQCLIIFITLHTWVIYRGCLVFRD